MKKYPILLNVWVLACLTLVGCGSLAPKKVLNKGSYYVRDRANDYHTSCLKPLLQVPEGLIPLNPDKAQSVPLEVLPKQDVNIAPPGVL